MENELQKRKGGVLSSALLLSSYTIGTGFLALPAASGPSGFWASTLTGWLICLFLICTGLLFLEALLTQPKGTSVCSLCLSLSGPLSAILSSAAFLFINYYISSSVFFNAVQVIKSSFPEWSSELSDAYYYLGLFFLFFLLIYWGTFFSSRLNFLFFVFLLVCSAGTFITGAKDITWMKHSEKNWYLVFFAVPLFVTSYDYQSVLPTVAAFLDKNVKKIVLALFIGIIFPLVLYTLWQWFVIRSTTSAELWEAFEIGSIQVGGFLKNMHEKPLFRKFFQGMTFFASITSLIGTALALFDFMSDAFKVSFEKRVGGIRFFLCLLVFVPSLVIGWAFPRLFVAFPSYFIGFAEVFFLGVLPIWLVFRIRYVLNLSSKRLLPGGKATLTALSFATFFLLYFESLQFFRKI